MWKIPQLFARLTCFSIREIKLLKLKYIDNLKIPMKEDKEMWVVINVCGTFKSEKEY